MVTNPLFHSYSLNKALFYIIYDNQMAQRGHSRRPRRGDETISDSSGQPKLKKRRLENAVKDEIGDWDDLEFTQQDLEKLDVIASQAMGGGIPEGEASTSRQGAEVEGRHRDQEQTLELESASFSAAEQDQSGIFQAPVPGATLRLKNRSSSSGTDSSIYPQSSASLRKTPSSDMSSAAGSLTRSSSSGEPATGIEGRRVSEAGPSSVRNGAVGSNIVTITALREDLRRKDVEAQKAQSELYAKEGEVKFLKEALHKQEKELERLRAERDERKEAEEQRQKEREKELKQDVERLQTQVQFKAQDLLQLQQRCQTLESRLQQQQAPSPSRPQPSTSAAGVTPSSQPQSPSKSPRLRKVDLRGSSTPEKGTFPSMQSFMAPRVTTGDAVQSVGTMTVTANEDGFEFVLQPGVDRGSGRERRQARRLRLDGCTFRGRTPGLQLLSQLFRCRFADSGEVEDSGIVGLLHMLPSRHDLMGLKYGRDSTTARLSPVKLERRSTSPGPQALLKQQSLLSPQPIVKREHFLQAMQGLQQLMDNSSSMPASDEQPRPLANRSGAVLLLPLLNDYLQHYIDILTSGDGGGPPESPSVSSSSNKSSSCEAGSSLESLTSSLGVLLQQGAEYANTMETLTLCALRVLNTLVCMCQDVRLILVMSRTGGASHLRSAANDTNSSTAETDQEKDKPSESGVEGDDERSTVSSKGTCSLLNISPTQPHTAPAARLQSLHLLHKVLRLASPSQESSGFKVAVVEAALDVLNSLVLKLPRADVDRLQVVLLRGVLSECLQLEHQPGVTVRALDLFSCLVQSHCLLPFLCTKAGMSDSCTSCTLLSVHMVLTRLLATCRGTQQLQPLVLSIISKVMDAVSAVVSFHRNGVHVLTDNNCRCSGQIIPSLVHAMFYLLRDYQVSVNEEVFGVLRKGVLLLHEISLRDLNYQQRYSAVLPHYSTLMFGLTRIYKHRTDLTTAEVSALEDLWEELDESDTYSQDSDHEEQMVTDS